MIQTRIRQPYRLVTRTKSFCHSRRSRSSRKIFRFSTPRQMTW
jgi:hypothetical protein